MNIKVKKIVTLFFILNMMISFFPLEVWAQTPVVENTESIATDQSLTELDDASQVLPEAESNILNSLSSDNNTPQSAFLKSPTKMREFSKKVFRADESATIIVDNAKAEDLQIKMFDFYGNEIEPDAEIVSTESPVVVKIHPPKQFKPGRYRIKVTDAENHTFNQEFTWGVLAINTNKSIYTPGEEALIAMAVLDETGEMVCNASLTLRITDPQGDVTTLTSEEGKIIVNPQCLTKDFTLIPDYQASYKVEGTGVYALNLSATTDEGERTIKDSFEVKENMLFDVERKTATRIYPALAYPVTFEITASKDFNGTVKEYVPAAFTISRAASDSAEVQSFDSVETVESGAEKDVLGADIFNIGLPYKGEHNLTLGFGRAHKDPTLSQKYVDFGVLGHDGVDFDLPMHSQVIAVDDGEVAKAGDGDYGITIVIQHAWGKSYYGHLDKLLVQEGDKVQKGKLIALSGDTGLSSGPHLHFGIKPEKNDTDNGYYGKINPLQFLGVADNGAEHGKVAGVSTSAQSTENGVKVISWKVNAKKGEKIKLSYQFNAPLISPELYFLGPLEFYDGTQKVFSESRKWQIAADAVVVSGGIVSSEAQFGGLQRKVAFVNSNWYAFYTDGTDVFWKKSSDGITWGSATNLDVNEDNDADNYNPSIDVSGNFIHVFYLDESADQVQGLRLDTTTDLTTQTSVCALTSPGAFTVSTYMVSVASLDATSAIIAYSDTNGGSNVDIFKATALDGTSCTVADIQPGNITFGSGITAGDRPVLVGLSSTKVAMVSQDGDLSYADFDVTENEWLANNMTIASVTDNVYSAVTDGAATPKVWVLSDAAADSTDTNFYTLHNRNGNSDFAETTIDSGAGATNDQDGISDLDMFCISATDCKIVYTENMNSASPDLQFIDCNNASCSSSSTRALDTSCSNSAGITCNPAIHCSSGTDCHIVYFDRTTAAAPDAVFIDCDGADDTDACSTNVAVITDSDLGTSASFSHFDIECPTGTNCKYLYVSDLNNGINFVDCADDQCATTTDTITEVIDYGTAGDPPNLALDCPSSTTCKVVGHDADLSSGSIVFVDCSTAGTPETCASPPAPDSIEGSVGTTTEQVSVGIDCAGSSTDCKVVYTNDTSDDMRFADCNDTDCDAPTETSIDTNGGAAATDEPGVSIYCVTATDCKILYTGAITDNAEKLYFVDCNDAACTAGSVIDTPGPRFRSALDCISGSTDCKMVYYEGSSASVPAVVFADCDTTNCYPSVTDDADPWTSEANVTSISLTYDSSNSDLIASILKDASEQAYYSVSDATTISWGSSTAYDGFTAGDLDNMSTPETAAGTSQMGVLLRQASNIEFDLFAVGGPTLDQVMRHGAWFSGGAEQAFTF